MDNPTNPTGAVNIDNSNNVNCAKTALKNTVPSDQPNRFTKRRQSDITKKVMFDTSVNRVPSRFLTQKETNPIKVAEQPPTSTQNEGTKIHQRKRYNSLKCPGQISFAKNLVEIIDGQGNISQEQVKGDKGKDDFCINRNKKMEGEFKKAEEFYLQNKDHNENEDDVDVDEEIITNTVRNKFVGKLNVIDSGMARAPLKKEGS